MKLLTLTILIFLLSACNDHRTNIERARDKWNACAEMGGRPELIDTFLGPFVNCEIMRRPKCIYNCS